MSEDNKAGKKKKRARMRNASIITVLIFSAMMVAAYFVAISAR